MVKKSTTLKYLKSSAIKPNLLVIIARPGAGKSTLIGHWRKNNRGYRQLDVYPFVKRVGIINGKISPAQIKKAYNNFYKYVSKVVRDRDIIEIGISHPELNMKNIARLKLQVKINIFFLIRNTKDCFKYKKKQRGKAYDSSELRERMRRPFPSTHNKLAIKYGLETNQILMHYGYTAAVRVIERVLDDSR
ncbi:hypothetical protein ACFL04_02945 [Patescibacteria group bacterium]